MNSYLSLKKLLIACLMVSCVSSAYAVDLLSESAMMTPHLTESTYFIEKDIEHISRISEPSEGIFYVIESNKDIGYGNYYSFYTVDGRCLFGPQWEQADEAPRFDSGAAVVRSGFKTADMKQPVRILYSNGAVKEMPVSWDAMTQFYDGVAKVKYSENGKMGIFYVNTKGEKIWPHLEITYSFKTNPSMVVKDGARYLRCGRRAFYDNEKKKWGYLDTNGKVVIPAQYSEVRDFENGYALVTISADYKDIPVFIDVDGKEIVRPDKNSASMHFANISDVYEGLYSIYYGDDVKYYDLSGKVVKKVAAGTPFFDGYAFIRMDDKYSGPVYAVNDKFDICRQVNYNSTALYYGIIETSPAGVMTVNHNRVYSAEGQLKLYSNQGDFIGRFSSDGYTKVEAKLTPGSFDSTYGIIGIDGNYVVAFETHGHRRSRLVPNEPVGPLDIITADYTVQVKVKPEGAATAAGSGVYKYGDTVKISGQASDGYFLSNIINETPTTLYGSGSHYEVRGNGAITLCFTKREKGKDENELSGAYQGLINASLFEGMDGIEFPIYLEFSKDGSYASPYGEKTNGVFSTLSDPNFTYEGKVRRSGKVIEDSKFTFNYFPVPMKVVGESMADDRHWLVVEGGNNIMANTAVLSLGSSNSQMNGLEVLMVNLMMIFDGFKDVALKPARYRIEMLDIDEKTGAFTFGELQRYSPEHGWLPGGDPRLFTYSRGLFTRKVDPGYSVNAFKGIRMNPAEKRSDISWYPPASFYDNNPTVLESVVRRLGQNYHDYKSDYQRLENLNIQDLSNIPDDF